MGGWNGKKKYTKNTTYFPLMLGNFLERLTWKVFPSTADTMIGSDSFSVTVGTVEHNKRKIGTTIEPEKNQTWQISEEIYKEK